jgi:hypothetical protein
MMTLDVKTDEAQESPEHAYRNGQPGVITIVSEG